MTEPVVFEAWAHVFQGRLDVSWCGLYPDEESVNPSREDGNDAVRVRVTVERLEEGK